MYRFALIINKFVTRYAYKYNLVKKGFKSNQSIEADKQFLFPTIYYNELPE